MDFEPPAEPPAVAENESNASLDCCSTEVGGREDKQMEADGQPVRCDGGVCCSFMMCEKFILFALHLFQRKCVCVPHCLDRLFPHSK